MTNEDLQKALHTIGYYKARIDGVLGKESYKAIDAFLETERIDGFKRWSQARRTVAAKQLVCRKAGIEVGKVDGLVGPQTRHAFEVFIARTIGDPSVETWRDKEDNDDDPISTAWPRQSQVRSLTSIYGHPGTNLTMIDLPWPMRIAWDKTKKITRVTVHEKIADSCVRVLNRVANEYNESQRKLLGLDLYGGTYNYRNARGASSLSMHAWAIAWDFDPERNQLKWGRDKARLAKPDCAMFLRLWREEGWLSLGEARNYDWMHIQAAGL